MAVVEKEIKNKIGILVGAKDIKQNWEIQNVIPTYRNNEIFSFNFSLPISTIIDLMDKQTLQYLPEIQRGKKLLKSGAESPLISSSKVKEIAERIKNNDLFGGTLSFVVLDKYIEEGADFNFDEENSTIFSNAPIFVVDGMHRIASARIIYDLWKKAKKNKEGKIDPEKYEFPVSLKITTIEQAKKMFAESTKSLKISKVRSEFLDIDTWKNYIVTELMKKSELRNKVETYATNIKAVSNNNNIVTFAVLSTEIDRQFKPKTKIEAQEISSYLIDYMDLLVYIFSSTMGDMSVSERKQAREKDYSLELLMWCGYISAAKALYGDENWREKIKKLRQPIEVGEWAGRLLDKDNPLWNSIKSGAGKLINGSPSQGFVRRVFSTFVTDENAFNELAKESLEKQKVS